MRGWVKSLFDCDMHFRDELKERLILEEGYEHKAYPDSKGILTIGVGHNLERPISSKAVEQILEDDLSTGLRDARSLYDDCWVELPRNVKKALVLMAFQMGKERFSKFVQMEALIKAGEYEAAADEALRSKWAREDSPERAKRVAALMKG